MNFRNRKIRQGIVIALAVVAAFVAWRMQTAEPKRPPCVPGREEVKDSSGKITEIKRTVCNETPAAG